MSATTDHAERRRELHAGYRTLNSALPDVMKGFGDLHKSAVADGSLPRSTKELIAMAVGITSRCEDCITLHMHDAIKAGATREQALEAIGADTAAEIDWQEADSFRGPPPARPR